MFMFSKHIGPGRKVVGASRSQGHPSLSTVWLSFAAVARVIEFVGVILPSPKAKETPWN